MEAASLVHALQNHDEMTYELVHFATLHRPRRFDFRGEADHRRLAGGGHPADLIDNLTGDAGPYNATFTPTASHRPRPRSSPRPSASPSIDKLTAEQVGAIKQAHLLLAMFNALQPGVFALSGWDLVGALTLDRKQVAAVAELAVTPGGSIGRLTI